MGAGEQLKLRNLIKERLSRAEIAQLAARVGDPSLLVAPKRRGEAEGLAGDALLDWLAADGAHLRRPIVVVGGQVLLGFTAEVKAKLEGL